MQTTAVVALMVLCFVAASLATQVSQCEGKSYPNLQENVNISKCNKPPCKLRKKTDVVVEIRFTPDHDVERIQTNVYAEILGLPLPFVGVDGISACDKILTSDGTAPVPCPLKKGVEYLYKNVFPVLEIYPRVNPIVHWSINENGKDISCFEVAAKIL